MRLLCPLTGLGAWGATAVMLCHCCKWLVLASLPALLAESCGTQICHDYAVTVTLMVFVVMLQPPT